MKLFADNSYLRLSLGESYSRRILGGREEEKFVMRMRLISFGFDQLKEPGGKFVEQRRKLEMVKVGEPKIRMKKRRK